MCVIMHSKACMFMYTFEGIWAFYFTKICEINQTKKSLKSSNFQHWGILASSQAEIT